MRKQRRVRPATRSGASSTSENAGNDSGTAPDKKPRIVVIADQSARLDPDSEFFRFLRDHRVTLMRFEIHCTQQTSETILGTGLYDHNDVFPHYSSLRGDELALAAVVELIAIVARREAVAVIFFSNPGVSRVDMIEYRVLKRVCIESEVRWLSSLQSAENWAAFEAPLAIATPHPGAVGPLATRQDAPRNVTHDGQYRYLRIPERTIALIAHDKKKRAMLDYVNEADNVVLLSQFNRVLATGTTGWLLKLRYAAGHQLEGFVDEAVTQLGAGNRENGQRRLVQVLQEIFAVEKPQLDGLLGLLRKGVPSQATFAAKVRPLASGPKGGDVLVAEEVLRHTCHAIIFFHDAETAHPHESDIELLERVSRLGGIYAVCVSDPKSARIWADGVRMEMRMGSKLEPMTDAAQMRQRYRSKGLREVILVDATTHEDGPEIGDILARAAAGYLHQRLLYLMSRKREIRVAVAFGYVMDSMVRHLRRMRASYQLADVARVAEEITFSPLIGIVRAVSHEQEAAEIAVRLASLYERSGGRFEGLPVSGFTLEEEGSSLRPELHKVVEGLSQADIVVSSGAPWKEDASLLRAGLVPAHCPPLTAGCSTIAGVFVDRDGVPAQCGYRVQGLTYEGLKAAARNGSVVLVCGGKGRENTVRAALQGELVSVLITNTQTAKAVLQ